MQEYRQLPLKQIRILMDELGDFNVSRWSSGNIWVQSSLYKESEHPKAIKVLEAAGFKPKIKLLQISKNQVREVIEIDWRDQ